MGGVAPVRPEAQLPASVIFLTGVTGGEGIPDDAVHVATAKGLADHGATGVIPRENEGRNESCDDDGDEDE
jgi:hypothetical protein